ncbi:NAD-dependent epimerase/dehydratase family protein [Streptomyces jumonjinensis]|uniref:NAD-dependent epimerase/dehydratase family protein n=1 Tax=Streptomyces jumonjinensis TaxID=1945 RepID=A0A646KA01_STRJU|nr:NAD-dependent epimerase/dehydratase family protein [Streptomyces jumonjinensis]MQS98919.1 NAD-dependent epimerase/dehydratase family protein [Streptomyces jumonjinensis]
MNTASSAAPVSLVTGGAGFIGSHVARELLAAGHQVIILDDLSGGTRANIPAGAEFRHGSVCDPEVVDAVFAAHRIDYVFHLAAYAAEGLSHFIKRFNYMNNVVGSVNLINGAVNAGTVKCFVFTSSIAVYGANQLPMSEDLTPAPEDPYGIAKYSVEQELKVTEAMFGLPYIVFRPHNVYGEYQNIGDRYRNVIGIFMNQALRGEEFTVFGDGEQTRAFSYIKDVAPAIARSVEIPAAYNGVFNVGGDQVYSVNRIAAAVCDAMGVELRVNHLPERHEVRDAYASHERAHKVFGTPELPVSLEEGIGRMAAWVKEVGPQEPSVFSGIEVVRNLPPSWRTALEQRRTI